MSTESIVKKHIQILAARTKVWDVLTKPEFSKILGNELDKGSFLKSDWKQGSAVYFMYEPDKIVATGKVTAWINHSRIFTTYAEIDYHDGFILTERGGGTQLEIQSGPYPKDYAEQDVAWGKWLKKVKELSEE